MWSNLQQMTKHEQGAGIHLNQNFSWIPSRRGTHRQQQWTVMIALFRLSRPRHLQVPRDAAGPHLILVSGQLLVLAAEDDVLEVAARRAGGG